MALAKRAALKKKLIARARAESKALKPYVKRALARHGRVGEKVFVVDSEGNSAWVSVSQRGIVKEPTARYRAKVSPAKKK